MTQSLLRFLYEVDRKERESDDGVDESNDECRSHDDRLQIDLCNWDLTTTSSPFNIMRSRARKKKLCNDPNWLQSSHLVPILLGIIMVIFDTRCLHVEAFAPNSWINELLRYCPSQPKSFPTRGVEIPRNSNFGHSSNSANSMAMPLFSSSPFFEQEEETANISLEWIEFYAPATEDDEMPEEQQAPVLFLHGLLGSKRNFATCANMLARQIDKKRRIIGVDLRNHGDTQPWSENMSYPSMAQGKRSI